MFVTGLNLPPNPSSPNPQQPPKSSNEVIPGGDEFNNLILTLRKILTLKKSFQIWDNSRGTECEFHTVLVEKNVRFPPLKARPTSTAQSLPLTLHSPISPLSPSSPLYPDGIMAPIWIRKHREMIPCVFVLVLRLGEYLGGGPLDVSAKEEEEKAKDAEIVREILERKRSTIERGIKLAVVLICSRELLDDPSLDLRLSLIRRQSGLDSKASLFVISPVPSSEVSNFITSLKSELFPSALDYYREHGRRVRRKRARQVPKGKLSDKGWNVRYDYKLAMFSEMRGEVEVSLKHYEDCYETLVEMFSNTTLLTPRTKRWAEAKVLADCLTSKISKMYLYLNEPSRAVAQLNRHTSRFRELSNTWGIGEQTFEFWSWLSKQYRLFADLTVIASRAGFRIPSLIPPPSSTLPLLTTTLSTNINSPGLIPSQILQHSGYYFYLSATCAVMRRSRFKFVLEGLDSDDSIVPIPMAIQHETKVNHSEIIIDLYTKAYEYFKVNKTSRMTLFIASKIAITHFEQGNHELALKFHERIARTYRREGYQNILSSIVELMLVSALHLEDWEMGIRCLVELLAPDSKISMESREGYAKKLLEVIKNNKPSTPEKSIISIDMSEVAPLLACRINFWSSVTNIGLSTPFQLSLISPPEARSSNLNFSSLEISFNDDRLPLVITNDESILSTIEGDGIDWYHLGELGEGKKEGVEGWRGRLNWLNGSTKVFTGQVSAGIELDLTISKVVLTLKEGDWTLKMEIKPDTSNLGRPDVWYSLSTDVAPINLRQSNSSICHVQPRQLDVEVKLEHASPAYLDEEYEVHLDISNKDEVEVEVFLDITLQVATDGSPNQILIDDLTSTSLLKEISLGSISPSTTIRKTFRLLSLHLPGYRRLDIQIRVHPTLLSSSPSLASVTEISRTLTIEAIQPLHAKFVSQFYKKRQNGKALLDMRELSGWENSSDVELVAKLGLGGPWEIEVVGLRLGCERTPEVRVASSSLDDEDMPLSLRWQTDDIFNVIYRLDVLPAPSLLHPTTNAGVYLEISWRRHNDNSTGPPAGLAKTIIPLPPLYSVPLSPSVTLPLPATMILHQPTTLTYKFTNPTRKVLTLTTQIDSSEGFVFAGPRKFPILILTPGEWRLIQIVVVPLVVGEWRIPRMRVFEIEKNNQDGREREVAGGKEEVRMKEIQVTEEIDLYEIKDPKQILLERELRKARGEPEDVEEVVAIKEFRTLILPA